jgi:hypothetical protein
MPGRTFRACCADQNGKIHTSAGLEKISINDLQFMNVVFHPSEQRIQVVP